MPSTEVLAKIIAKNTAARFEGLSGEAKAQEAVLEELVLYFLDDEWQAGTQGCVGLCGEVADVVSEYHRNLGMLAIWFIERV